MKPIMILENKVIYYKMIRQSLAPNMFGALAFNP